MSRFVKTLAMFVAGLQLMPSKAADAYAGVVQAPQDDDAKGVSLQPLNGKFDNLFASHSSHRSHSSHSSHYSGSSGRSSAYVAPTTTSVPSTPASPPAQAPAQSVAEPVIRESNERGSASSAKATSNNAPDASSVNTGPVTSPTIGAGADTSKKDVQLTRAEKLHLQVFRVQIRLNSLGLYSGAISGTFDPATRKALKQFQVVKNLPDSGLMTTDTLNALAIPAVK